MASFFNSFRSTDNSGSISLPTTAEERSSNGFSIGATFSNLNPFNNSNAASDPPVVVNNDPGMFNLSRMERIVVFLITLAGSFICYALCFFLLPILSLKPRKFAILWTLGSLLFLTSFGILQGWYNYYKHLVSVDRLWFTISFFGSIIATLVFSLVYKSTILVIVCCALQGIASIWYTVSYFPYGRRGLDFTAGMARTQVESWINS